MNHILTNIQLPTVIRAHSRDGKLAHVKVVMSKSMVNGVPKGGAMITTNWKDIVRQNGMRVNHKFVFWFRRSKDGGVKLLVDQV